jgi:hypothetical protein
MMRAGKSFIVGMLVALAVTLLPRYSRGADFFACYTRLDYTQPQDTDLLGQIPVNASRVFAGGQADGADKVPRPPAPGAIRWGKYADLIVNVAKGRRLVFSRATGYLPYLETSEGRFPLKPLVECRPDRLCLCSYVRVVEETPNRIVVHWRHVPDPANIELWQVIHEYFTITPDGIAQREVHIGARRLEDFRDPANVTLQRLQLTDDGITELSLVKAKVSDSPAPPVPGRPTRELPDPRPAVWMRFDDGLKPNRGRTREAINGAVCPIEGSTALFKKGVSGTALAFDGYFSKVALPRDNTSHFTDSLTVQAWVALGAYPWNDAGIVHCSSGTPIDAEAYKHGYRDPYTYRPWLMDGFMLGIDPYGRPLFKINGKQVGGGVVEPAQTVAAGDRLPTYRWTHLAATYGDGWMRLYRDGKLVASQPATGPIALPDRQILIGLNGDAQRISDPVSHSNRAANNNLPLVYGIEGLIDEVILHDRVLSADEVRRHYEAFCPPAAELTHPDLDQRILPGEVPRRPAGSFGATCETLKYHELWDNLWRPGRYRDILVQFETTPGSVVFWQGTNFGSGWVTENNKWMSDQSWEIGGPHGCAEHMADKRGRFDHVRLIENSAARVVVHWRYASIDVGYVFGHTGVWADEYYTIYPDGVGVRHLDGIRGGWQDTQFLSQPGTACLDNIDLTALTVANMDGQSQTLQWQAPNHVPANPIEDACIKRINFKSQWKVFAVYREGARINQWGAQEQSKHTPDPFAGPWNHWPVGLNPSDGRYAVANDRVTHAALGGARNTGDMILYGFTDQPTADLAPLAKSWNRPAKIEKTHGCECAGYDPSQRAYILTARDKPLSFTVAGSTDSPIHNLCFVINNWDSAADARLAINGKDIEPGRTFRQGNTRTASGGTVKILFVTLASEEPVAFTLQESTNGSDAPAD